MALLWEDSILLTFFFIYPVRNCQVINIALNINNKPKHLVVVARHSPDLKSKFGDFSKVSFWLILIIAGRACDCSGGNIVP